MIINPKKIWIQSYIQGKSWRFEIWSGSFKRRNFSVESDGKLEAGLAYKVFPLSILKWNKALNKDFCDFAPRELSCPLASPAETNMSTESPLTPRLQSYFFQHFFREALNYQRDEIRVLFLFYRKGSGKNVPFSCHLQLSLGPPQTEILDYFLLDCRSI